LLRTYMQISQRGIDLILEFEGKKTLLPDGRYKAYLDTLAKPPIPTIYCGLTKGIRMGMVITKEEGDIMFARELAVYEDAVERLVKVPLNENQHAALVSFVYNCGPGALGQSTLLKLLNRGDYSAVPSQLMRWTKAGGKEWPGLVRRRHAEGVLFMTPIAPVLAHSPSVQHANEDASTDVVSEDHMPQQVSVVNGSITQAAQTSWTIRAAAMSMLGGLVQAWNWLFSTAQDASTEIAAIKAATGPFDALLAAMKANMVGIAAGIVITGSAIAIARRLLAAREGKQG
jgi:lysozyme